MVRVVCLSSARPEITQFHRPFVAKQKVLHLEVAVNNRGILAVHVLHRFGSLVEHLKNHIAREGTAARSKQVHQLTA